jgi:hypothetical protein
VRRVGICDVPDACDYIPGKPRIGEIHAGRVELIPQVRGQRVAFLVIEKIEPNLRSNVRPSAQPPAPPGHLQTGLR